jgi:hypothetical protein
METVANKSKRSAPATDKNGGEKKPKKKEDESKAAADLLLANLDLLLPPEEEKRSQNDEIKSYSIGRFKKIVQFKSSDGEFRLDLRKLDADGNPTGSGIVLDRKQFETLISLMPLLDEKLDDAMREPALEYKRDIGGNAFVNVSGTFGTVDVRHYYFDRRDGTKKPTKRGVAFNRNEFDIVKSVVYPM